MYKLIKYTPADADKIVGWLDGEETFYNWSAGKLGDYPATQEKINGYYRSLENIGTFRAFMFNDGDEAVGHVTVRSIGKNCDEVRLGFVIVASGRRGEGIAKKMLTAAVEYAENNLNCKKISIGVLENNVSAYKCYKAFGFEEVVEERCIIRNTDVKCVIMQYKK